MKKTDTPIPSVPTTVIDLEATWTYAQKSGALQQDGKPVSTGYSGADAGQEQSRDGDCPQRRPHPAR
jgi:hypothetical protein